MAGNQLDGDLLSSNFAAMSKNQMYEIMSKMKTMVDQNHDQARDILVQNPGLTRGLFQAQIMLGMVQSPQTASDTRSTASQELPPPPLSNVQPSLTLPVQTSSLDQTYMSNSPLRRENQPVIPVLPSSIPPVLHQQQQRGHQNIIQPPLMPSLHQLPILNSQPPAPLQPPLSNTGPTQPPLPPQPRPPSMQNFPHQMYPQKMGTTTNFPHSVGPPHMHNSQPMFHPGVRPPPPNMGPSFSQGQPPFPTQLPPQPVYQQGGGLQKLGMEYGQGGSSVQGDRGSGWMPENASRPPHFPAPPPPQPQQPPLPAAPFPPPAQMGPTTSSYQAPQAPPQATPMTPDMEQALLQQVMSLTPEQITMLPPEQRSQVLQLQQIMRK